ncbi:MAG: hypothetical protein M3Q06_07120, partial [Bacteroidota bacterium]|nr:hypothetical protein [Bacteroidota bacterium]
MFRATTDRVSVVGFMCKVKGVEFPAKLNKFSHSVPLAFNEKGIKQTGNNSFTRCLRFKTLKTFMKKAGQSNDPAFFMRLFA